MQAQGIVEPAKDVSGTAERAQASYAELIQQHLLEVETSNPKAKKERDWLEFSKSKPARQLGSTGLSHVPKGRADAKTKTASRRARAKAISPPAAQAPQKFLPAPRAPEHGSIVATSNMSSTPSPEPQMQEQDTTSRRQQAQDLSGQAAQAAQTAQAAPLPEQLKLRIRQQWQQHAESKAQLLQMQQQQQQREHPHAQLSVIQMQQQQQQREHLHAQLSVIQQQQQQQQQHLQDQLVQLLQQQQPEGQPYQAAQEGVMPLDAEQRMEQSLEKLFRTFYYGPVIHSLFHTHPVISASPTPASTATTFLSDA